MAPSHPYISGHGNIKDMINRLRSNFPSTITADTVKQFGIAPKNESYVINALQFLELIDQDGKKNEENAKAFLNPKDLDFQTDFSKIVASAYSSLFELYGDKAWKLEMDALTKFFRQTDQTSDAIGRRQANVFRVLSGLSGKIDNFDTRNNNPKPKKNGKASESKRKQPNPPTRGDKPREEKPYSEFSMAVRVEVNLPPNATRETYDAIFKSIKENLIND